MRNVWVIKNHILIVETAVIMMAVFVLINKLWYRYSEQILTTKIFKNRVTWDFQLNIYNVLNDTYLTTREAVDDGTGKPYVTRRLFNQEPRSYQLTSSFSF